MIASEEDDPMSASFIPLAERLETERARWWANRAKAKRLRRNFAEFD